MKRCPTCDKTFDDNLKFCQIDGTALIGDSEEVDPFKTMVASKDEIAAAMASLSAPPQEPVVPEEQVLEIPEAFDSGKTQVVSEAELRAEMAKLDVADENVIDVPPAVPEPEAPKFIEPSVGDPEFSLPPPNDFGESSPAIPSPFGNAGLPAMEPPSSFTPFEPPSPFSIDALQPEAPAATPQFADPEPDYNPFEHSAPKAAEPLAKADWTPPAAIESNMQNQQNFGQNPSAAVSGQNNTLALVSLISGILGLTLCCGTFIVPLVAVITGFMAKGKASNDPANYGGAGLALGGLITGAIGLVISIIFIIYMILNFALVMAMIANQ